MSHYLGVLLLSVSVYLPQYENTFALLLILNMFSLLGGTLTCNIFIIISGGFDIHNFIENFQC